MPTADVGDVLRRFELEVESIVASSHTPWYQLEERNAHHPVILHSHVFKTHTMCGLEETRDGDIDIDIRLGRR